MGAVVSREGIRTERRISHCFIMDVPGHVEPIIITDAAVNIAPDLDAKVDIVQNAIDLAHAMGDAEVRVALLSAMETVTAKVPSTVEAAALCKMADRGQITGALLDGPLALDNAISRRPRRSRRSHLRSPGARTCSSFRTSRRGTCWPRACPSSRERTPRASCSARACRSF
jgi:phosphate acetyltransferase